MKILTSSKRGSRDNSSKKTLIGSSTSPLSSRDHSASETSGWIPRSRTGKPLVKCCPGGSRSLDRLRTRELCPAIFLSHRSLRSRIDGFIRNAARHFQDCIPQLCRPLICLFGDSLLEIPLHQFYRR